MTLKELRKRRNTRKIENKARNIVQEQEEKVIIADSGGEVLPCCSNFKYLGTMITPRTGMTTELRRRTALARSTIKTLKQVWRSRSIGRGLKRTLFTTLILSILLYNAETWVLTQSEHKFLRMNYIYLARCAMGERRKPIATGTWESSTSFLERHRLESVEKMIARKKAVWIGHFQRAEYDIDFKEQMNQLRDENCDWWQQTKADFEKLGTSVERVIEAAKLERAECYKTIHNMFLKPGRTACPQQANA
jgi:hypothetical protein